jgi:hypothetical protein
MSEDQLRLQRAAPVPHTPGPWRVARHLHGWTILGPTPRAAIAPTEWFIARTVTDEPEDEPNARLMGLAPELLAALKTKICAVECACCAGERALIAQAEGR